jgi:hypothetical protein
MLYGVPYHTFTWYIVLESDMVFRFCFAPDVSRPLLELEQMFFNSEQHGGNGKITWNLHTLLCN